VIYPEFIEKYGDEEVSFRSYYKYTFSFTSENGLTVYVGGNHDDIYRLCVEANKKYKISELEPSSAYMNDECLLHNIF